MFDVNWSWYRSNGAYIWQQCICWTFIILSGFCYSFGRKKLKRGMLVFLCGLLISIVTCTLMPESRVLFGILTLLGSCMLLMLPLETLFKKMNPYLGFFVSFSVFVLIRNINNGFLGFEKWNLIQLPNHLYKNLFTAYIGFPANNFYSTDYFALLPWFFLFLAGFFLHHIFKKNNWLKNFAPHVCKPLEWIGKHTLPIYVVHQPIIYGVLSILFSL
jgi:uncharacterized membrane protein